MKPAGGADEAKWRIFDDERRPRARVTSNNREEIRFTLLAGGRKDQSHLPARIIGRLSGTCAHDPHMRGVYYFRSLSNSNQKMGSQLCGDVGGPALAAGSPPVPCPYQKTHPTCEMIFFASLPSLIHLAGRSSLRSRLANLLLRYSLAPVFRLNLTVFLSLFLKQLADRDDAVHQLGELR
jgi:hypothetical protein